MDLNWSGGAVSVILKNYILSRVQIMENPSSHSESCCFCYKNVCFVGDAENMASVHLCQIESEFWVK